MKMDELRALQDVFSAHMQTAEFKNEKQRLDDLLSSFHDDFPAKTVLSLSLDEFVVGQGDKDSFCNRLENQLNGWGNIHGSTAIKFGIYFGRRGDVENDFHHAARFGMSTDEAFRSVKDSIVDLIQHGCDENISALKRNKISPMVKGKILSVYYPKRYLNIFSKGHLEFFLKELGVSDIYEDELDMRAALIRYKNGDKKMHNWDLYTFNKFMYHSLYGDEAYANTSSSPLDVIPDAFDITVDEFKEIGARGGGGRKGKADYDAQSRNKRRVGERGEVIVLTYEKRNLRENGLEKLVSKVVKVSDTDDSAGYDILSFDKNGRERYIEVKSTVNKRFPSTFYITENELAKLSELNNSYIYFVNDVDGDTPIIRRFKLKSRDQIDDLLVPVAYQFLV